MVIACDSVTKWSVGTGVDLFPLRFDRCMSGEDPNAGMVMSHNISEFSSWSIGRHSKQWTAQAPPFDMSVGGHESPGWDVVSWYDTCDVPPPPRVLQSHQGLWPSRSFSSCYHYFP